MKSIRLQLTTGLLASLFLLVAAGGAVLFGVIHKTLKREFDSALLSKSRSLASLMMLEARGTIEFEFSEEMMPSFKPGADPEYFEVRNENGETLARSSSLGAGHLPIPDAPYSNMELPSGYKGRVVNFHFSPQFDPEDWKTSASAMMKLKIPRFQMIVAQSREPLNRLLGEIIFAIVLLGLVLPLAIAVCVHWIVRRGLRPLDRVAAEAAAVDTGNLRHRFPESEMPRELQPICHRLNDLLERIELAFSGIQAAYQRERRFNNDVAHELRTPIAELHSLSEIALLYPANQDIGRKALSETLAISRQMERLVSALLSLARCEAGIETTHLEPVDLLAALGQAWHSHQERAAARKVGVRWQLPDNLIVETDRTMLLSVLGNLIANAVEYSPAGGEIRVQVREDSGKIQLVIENPNDTLAAEDLPRIFDPFWRKDDARTGGEHSGLGLALVRAMCRVMQIEIETRLTETNNFHIELELEK